MNIIREPICDGIIDGPVEKTFDSIRGQLATTSLDILSANESGKSVTIRATIKLFDMFFWRCWSEKVVIQCTPHENKARVRVYALPSILKTAIKKDERVFGKTEMAEILGKAIGAANHGVHPIAEKAGPG